MADFDFKLLLETLSDAIVAADITNRVVYVNEAVSRLLGWTKEELIGAPLTTIMPARMRPFHDAGFARYAATRQTKIMRRPVRVPALHKDGTELDIELTLNSLPLSDGGELLVAAIRDLRDRVELERQVGENRRIVAQYEAMRVLSEATSLRDAGPALLSALARALDWRTGLLWMPTGHPPELRTCATFTDHPDLHDFIEKSERLSLPAGVGLPGRVWRTGEAAWIRDITLDDNYLRKPFAADKGLRGAFAFPIRNQRQVVAVAEFYSNDAREPDDELMRTAASIGGNFGQFLRRVKAEDEREGLLIELQGAVRARDEFLSVASHELKTPLTPLLLKLDGLDRLLRKQPQTELTVAVQSVVDTGRRQVSRLSDLVNDLLDVSRIESGKLSVHLKLTDLSAVISEVAARYDEQARSVGSRLLVDLHPGIEGLFDRNRIEQIAVNLFDNALKYGHGGDVEISLAAEHDHAILRVRDHGIGIAADSLERIFDRFERAVSDRHYGGLGLGLYITRTLVEAMHGSISVESRPGEGATFRVALPIA